MADIIIIALLIFLIFRIEHHFYILFKTLELDSEYVAELFVTLAEGLFESLKLYDKRWKK